MAIDVSHPVLGACFLTTDHAASSYGISALVDKDGNPYGPGDLLTTPGGEVVTVGAFPLTEPVPGAWDEESRRVVEAWGR